MYISTTDGSSLFDDKCTLLLPLGFFDSFVQFTGFWWTIKSFKNQIRENHDWGYAFVLHLGHQERNLWLVYGVWSKVENDGWITCFACCRMLGWAFVVCYIIETENNRCRDCAQLSGNLSWTSSQSCWCKFELRETGIRAGRSSWYYERFLFWKARSQCEHVWNFQLWYYWTAYSDIYIMC